MPLFQLPDSVDGLDGRSWETFAPYFAELKERPLSKATVRQWLEDWSHLSRLLMEACGRIYIHKTLDTADKEKEAAFLDVINNVYPEAEAADQALKERLLALNLDTTQAEFADLTLVLRDMQNESDIFRAVNIPLQTQLRQLENEYDTITGALKTDWDGSEKNLSQLTVFLQSKDRDTRERAWRAMMALWQSCRDALNKLYVDMLALRRQIAANADFGDFRAYAFREKGRFDYSPEDCLTFHAAIEAAVVPAAERILARKRARMGVAVLKPWDWVPELSFVVQPGDKAELKPYDGQDDLIQHGIDIFNRVDPRLGRYFAEMAEYQLLDLDTRQGKALGGYCYPLSLQRRPFIFMNGVGTHNDVQTLLHEAGHAFHTFEARLPLIWQESAPMEFCEVASMSMELLASPYLTRERGGFYTAEEAARARVEHLEGAILFWPYMAVVDAFQHWVYTHPTEAAEPTNLDAKWTELCGRYLPGIDWAGFTNELESGWHRKLHIFQIPFYYVEYGMAQVGALQVWRNSLEQGQAAALAAYRQALALGGTLPLPDLFAAAGAEFRFDTAMLSDLVGHIEATIAELETAG